MKAAHFWGKSPSEWMKEPRWSRAAMIQFVRDYNAMEYWQYEDSQT